MRNWRVLHHVAMADFRERTRRNSFLLVLAAAIYAGYISVPAATAHYSIMSFAGSRSLYTSSWVGTMVALFASGMLALPGFHLVANAIGRDRATGVGDILAATPLSKWTYVWGKAISNFMVLALMVLVLAISALAMQFIRGEDLAISLWQLWAPFLWLALPTTILVAALAVFFETVPALGGTLGNLVYFFVWVLILTPINLPASAIVVTDVTGLWFVHHQVAVALRRLNPGLPGGFAFINLTDEAAVPRFRWEGFSWGPSLIVGRLLWVAVSVTLLVAASLVFDRFRSREGRRKRRSSEGTDPATATPAAALDPAVSPLHLDQAPAARRPQFGMMIWQELRLAIRSIRTTWAILGAGLFIASFLAPMPAAQSQLLPLLWLWAMPLWSSMGVREAHYGTQALVFSADRSLNRQLPALWIAGFCSSLLAGLGVAVRLAAGGSWAHLAAYLAGAAFIPSLALMLGVWTHGSRTFEVLYTVLWYAGPWQKTPQLDFIGSSSQSLALHTPFYFLLAAFIALALAILGRWRQVFAGET